MPVLCMGIPSLPIMSYVDLHCHSSFSDGTHTPAQLIELAQKYELTGLALTDHDTVEGVEQFLQQGKQLELEVISGVELSANHGSQPVHILGYGFDLKQTQFHHALQTIQQDRQERNKAITSKLQQLGLQVSYQDITTLAGGGQVGRPHFAHFLVKQRRAHSLQDAFNRYLRKGRPAYVARRILPAQKAITMIQQAGGAAVLAHPGTIQRPWPQLEQLFSELVDFGLEGIECYYPIHSQRFREQLMAYCRRHKLLITGGSDYHGDIRPSTRLGCQQKKQRTPFNILIELQNYIEQKQRRPALANHEHPARR